MGAAAGCSLGKPSEDEQAPSSRCRREFKRQIVSYTTARRPGTIVIDTPNYLSYYVLGGGRGDPTASRRTPPVLPGRVCNRLSKRPSAADWTQPPERSAPALSAAPDGRQGSRQSLGARRCTCGGTIYRIHAPRARRPSAPGFRSGASALNNEDAQNLYSASVGTKVIVLPMDRRATIAEGKRSLNSPNTILKPKVAPPWAPICCFRDPTPYS